MSYTLVLWSITLLMALAECLAAKYKTMQRQIYYLAFAFVAVWCIIKYAVGPDIVHYVPFYQSLQSPAFYVGHPQEAPFEIGFTLFCSALKGIGVSFWGMTALVDVLYFGALFWLFEKMQGYRTVALLVMVVLDFNLMVVELRQCLAVAFFILFVLLFQKARSYRAERKAKQPMKSGKWAGESAVWELLDYAGAVACALLSMGMHKSALWMVLATVVLYGIGKIPVSHKDYWVLGLLLALLLFVPLQPLLLRLVQVLPLGSDTLGSIEHHLQVGKSFQRLFLLYGATILCLAYYKQGQASSKRIHWLIWCCLAVLVCLYPYWFLLNRLRSYFLPFVAVYVVNTLLQTEVSDRLPKQLYGVFIWLYMAVFIGEYPFKDNGRYPTDRVSVVLERFNHTEQELMNRQMKQATLYWEYDYPVMVGKGMRK